MSAEKFFALKVVVFSVFLAFCPWFCMLFLALLAGVLWCVSTWFVVRFDVACGAHHLC